MPRFTVEEIDESKDIVETGSGQDVTPNPSSEHTPTDHQLSDKQNEHTHPTHHETHTHVHHTHSEAHKTVSHHEPHEQDAPAMVQENPQREQDPNVVDQKAQTPKEEQFWTSDEEKNGFEHPQTQANSTNGNHESGSTKSWIWVGLIVVGVLLVAGGALWYLNAKNELDQEIAATPIETSTPLPTPTATPQAVVPNYATYKAQVLNGSGIPGEAGEVQTVLEGLGMSSIDTGNAKAFTHKMTLLQAKKDTPQEVIDGIKKELSKTYEVEIGTTLDTASKYDLLITVGSTKAE